MWKLVTSVGGAIVFVVGIGGTKDDLETWFNWVTEIPPDVGWGFLIALGLGLLAVNLLPGKARRKLLHLVPESIRTKSQRQEGKTYSRMADNVVVFQSTRRELGDSVEYISRFEVVWALWHTATEVDNRDIWEKGRLRKLVLIEPNSAYLEMQSKATGRTAEELRSVIMAATTRAQKAGVKVKWFAGPIPAAITIGNPESNPIVLVEPLMLYASARDRQSYLLDARHGEAIQKQLTQFRNVWKNSTEPTTQ